MKDSGEVEHSGTVVEVGPETVTVQIEGKAACAGCHARGGCSLSGDDIKLIEVPLGMELLAAGVEKGDEVVVTLKSTLGLKAVWLAYVAPLALLLAAIFTASLFNIPELYVGLIALGVVIFYYIVLAIFKDKLSRVFTFSVTKR